MSTLGAEEMTSTRKTVDNKGYNRIDVGNGNIKAQEKQSKNIEDLKKLQKTTEEQGKMEERKM